jgi:N-acetylneuraminic acid mutarotase
LVEPLERRQLLAGTPTPFHGTPFLPGQNIEAEDFDNGGEGVAFHDTTPTNTGNASYRPTQAVDIRVGGSNGFDVGYCYAGEWLNYTVNIVTAGTFTLSATVANAASGGAFHVGFGGVNKTGTMAVPNSGGWNTFNSITSQSFSLPAGTQVMHVMLDKGGALTGVANFDFFKLNNVTPPPNSPLHLQWKAAAPALVSRMEGAGIELNGKLYTFGGYDESKPAWVATYEVDAYDPSTNTWTRLADAPTALTHQGIATDGRYIYVAGGYVSNTVKGSQTFASTNVWRYDTQLNTWSAFTPLPAARGAGSMVCLGRTLHFFGGTDGSLNGKADHWTLNLDAAQPKWVAAVALPAPRNHAAAVVLNNKIYVVGGQAGSNDKAPESDVFVWDPASPTVWTHAASLPGKLSHEAAVVANGQIVVVDGFAPSSQLLSQVLAYDPTKDQWTKLANLPIAVASPEAGVIGNKLVVSGGGIYFDLLKNTWVTNLS